MGANELSAMAILSIYYVLKYTYVKNIFLKYIFLYKQYAHTLKKHKNLIIK